MLITEHLPFLSRQGELGELVDWQMSRSTEHHPQLTMHEHRLRSFKYSSLSQFVLVFTQFCPTNCNQLGTKNSIARKNCRLLRNGGEAKKKLLTDLWREVARALGAELSDLRGALRAGSPGGTGTRHGRAGSPGTAGGVGAINQQSC